MRTEMLFISGTIHFTINHNQIYSKSFLTRMCKLIVRILTLYQQLMLVNISILQLLTHCLKRLLFITQLQTFYQNRTYQLCSCSEVNISVDVQSEIYLK